VHLVLAQLCFDQRRWSEAADAVDRELVLVPESMDALELKAKIETAKQGR
jgi:hypothetical protein